MPIFALTFTKLLLAIPVGCCKISQHAGVAELADAYGSGPYESNLMKVQVLSPAPLQSMSTSVGLASGGALLMDGSSVARLTPKAGPSLGASQAQIGRKPQVRVGKGERAGLPPRPLPMPAPGRVAMYVSGCKWKAARGPRPSGCPRRSPTSRSRRHRRTGPSRPRTSRGCRTRGASCARGRRR